MLGNSFVIGIFVAVTFFLFILCAIFVEKAYFAVTKSKVRVDWYSMWPQYWRYFDVDIGLEIDGYVDTCIVANRSRISVEKIEFRFANTPESFSFEKDITCTEKKMRSGFSIIISDVEADTEIKLTSYRLWPENAEGVQKVIVNGKEIRDKFEHKTVDADAYVFSSEAMYRATTVFFVFLILGLSQFFYWLLG